jgi:hypothetical protein
MCDSNGLDQWSNRQNALNGPLGCHGCAPASQRTSSRLMGNAGGLKRVRARRKPLPLARPSRNGRLEMTEQNHPDAEPPSHAYDDPTLSARAFMLAVMHDPSVPIHNRMDAASKLLRIYGPNSFNPPAFTYVIPHCPSLSSKDPDASSDRKNTNQQSNSAIASQ